MHDLTAYDRILCKRKEACVAKKQTKKMNRKSKLEIRHAEIIKRFQTTISPLPDNASLAQPSPLTIFPTVVTYSAYEEPILANTDS